ncbi:glycoside hydrolase family 16 protein [Xylariaceae sp. FL0594]|nr:glycoside hydrolase family 16 protein [Xylariaceae sp. FL0594]
MLSLGHPFVAASLAATVALLSGSTTAQTYTECNPLQNTCPSDPALGKTIEVDFTKGPSDLFTPSGGTPTYDANGVSFTVAKSGDSPQLNSLFYIMFGRVEISMKAAPGAGIVSSLVFESDCLDEIDNEWLGAVHDSVQTNYFGKGITGSYNRAQFNPTPENQDKFITYTVDWTSDRILWAVGEDVVRILNADEADNEYPQTPMQIKFGAWSGGDPSNSAGTIGWAHGPTDYSQGPYTMLVQRVKITDYSTGSKYTYGDNSGSWKSIKAEGGSVNGNLGSGGGFSTTVLPPASSASPTSVAGVPIGSIGSGSGSSSSKLPPGWVMTSDGKIVPSSSASVRMFQPLHTLLESLYSANLRL